MNDRKFVSVMSGGIIKELGGIGGPIMNPCNIAIDKVKKMVLSGRKVYEHNPKNPDEKVLLTEENVLADNFSCNSTPVAPAPAPATKVEETPAPAAPVEASPVEEVPVEENANEGSTVEEERPVNDYSAPEKEQNKKKGKK